MRAHPLKGVEPELYNPEELLGGDRAPVAASRPLPEAEDHQPTSSWFTHWFGLSDARATASSDIRNAALHQPPFVSDAFPVHFIACRSAGCDMQMPQASSMPL